MQKYTDDDIRNMNKITCKIAADYLGIYSMAVSIGMRNTLLSIGFAIHNEERDRQYYNARYNRLENEPEFLMNVCHMQLLY